jgi:hypothetical protein
VSVTSEGGIVRSIRFGLPLFLIFFVAPSWAQQAAPLQPQQTAQTPEQASAAIALIQSSLTVQNGGRPITDVTLNGSITFTQDATKGTGTFSYAASASGQSRSTITVLSGTETSFRDYSVSPKIGTYSGVDGVSKNANSVDMIGPHPALYFPAFIMASSLSASGFARADMGQETQDGATVRHVALWPAPTATVTVPTAANQQPEQQDIFLDPATLLPVALSFNLVGTNPDKRVTPFRKIPIYASEEVRFSDYRQVQGLPVAFHIQVYVQKTLVIDIQLSSVNVNTGVVVSGG